MSWKSALAAWLLVLLPTSARAQFGPEITSEPVTTATVGVLYQYDVEAGAGDIAVFALNQAPEGMTIDAQSGLISWLPEKAGDYEVSVLASAFLGSDTQDFVITVSEAAEAPVIVSTAPTTGRVNVAYSYDVNATGVPAPTYELLTSPTGMQIDPSTGLISWTPATPGNAPVTVQASNKAGAVTQAFTIAVAEAFVAPQIISQPITSGQAGEAYRYDVAATGNPSPTFTLTEYPEGMSIDATTGLIAWTPQQPGEYAVAIEAMNSEGQASQSYTLTVSEAFAEPLITSTAVLTATTGVSYTYDVNASGNPTPTYSLTSAPSGMAINATTGVISWTPPAAGTVNVTVRAVNTQGDDTQSFAILVSDPLVAPEITTNPVLTATAGQAYSYNVNATGNPNPVFALSSAPAGMTINSGNGLISWTPGEAGVFSVTVEASNEVGSDSQTFDITVAAPLAAPEITSVPTTQAFLGQTYRYDLEATGNPAPTFNLVAGPQGMTIDGATGEISWTPAATGSFNVSVDARNSQGRATQLFTISVSQSLTPPSFTSTPVSQGIVGQAFRYDADALGNPAPTYELKSGPEGMTVASVTGVVSWTPTSAGTFEVVLEASNSQGDTEQNFAIVVGEPLAAPQITSAPQAQTIVDLPYSYDVEASGNPAPTFKLLTSPTGMIIDEATGVISWTPRATGTFNVSVQALNTQGSATQLFSLRVENTSSVAVLRSQTIEINGPASYNFVAVVSANGSPTTVTFEYGKDSVTESTILATPTPVVGLEIPIATRVDNLEEGATYLFRVVAENGAGKTTGPVLSFTTYRSSYDIEASLPFGTRMDSLSYRLYSVPGDVDLNASTVLSGTQDVDWNIYRDNGAAANFFEEFNGSTQFRFRPGRAFWMLSRTNLNVPEQTVSTVELDRDGTFDLRLQAGWNLISSPFLLPLPWDILKEKNPALPITAKLWTFNGTFQEATALEPYRGYYVFIEQSTPLTINLPFPGLYPTTGKSVGRVVGKTGTEPVVQSDTTGVRRLRLLAATDSLMSAAEVYFSAEAGAGLDRLDQYAPRGFQGSLSLTIEPAFETPYGVFALEARPEDAEGAMFDLRLDAPSGKPITFTLDGLVDFEQDRVMWMDRTTGEMTDLHRAPTLHLPAGSGGRYRLLIGPDTFIEAQREALAPETFQLAPAYPNPFAGSTTIEFSLLETSEVDLAVYDVLGREVDVLVRGTQPAGFHQVTWDAGQSPSGMYVVRLSTEAGPTQVRTLVKVQ